MIKVLYWCTTLLLRQISSLFSSPMRTPGGFLVENTSSVSPACRKRRLNGAVCRNHRIKRVVPCRCRTGTLKNPAKCLSRWEPDRRYNFFNPPAHLCRYMYDWNIVACDVKHQLTHLKPFSLYGKKRRDLTQSYDWNIVACYVRLGYCFTPYQRLWLYNGAPLVAFYDTLEIRRTYSRLKPRRPHGVHVT